ncbi:hypothetical protein [Micromonospora sp. NBC_01813]|nr:hypothetical protein [Micromonospora sp. NBC_01813]WSA10680.1 hypothetical protein OG958_07855 [Micromonospora sp. NBC_01813]
MSRWYDHPGRYAAPGCRWGGPGMSVSVHSAGVPAKDHACDRDQL